MSLDQVQLAPNDQNFFYGKGKIFFDREDTDGNATGLLHMGLCDSFGGDLTTTMKSLEGSESGPKEVLKVVEVGPRKWTGDMKLREFSAENLNICIGGDTIQSASKVGGTGGAVSAAVVLLALDRWLQIQHTQSAVLVDTMPIAQYNKSTTPWTALDAPVVSHGSTTLIEGTDYDIDYEAGLIIFYSGKGAAALTGETINVTCKIYDVTMKVLSPSYRPIRGKLVYVSTADSGQRWKVTVWKAVFQPKTKLELIKDDFGVLELAFDMQSDKTNHPSNPYFMMEQMVDGSVLHT